MDKHMLSYGKFRVLFNEYGEVEKLEFRGHVFEGDGDVVHIPIRLLHRVKLSEIPQNVFIEPVLDVKNRVVYALNYGSLFSYEVLVGRGISIIDIMDRKKYWSRPISLDVYVSALDRVMAKLERQGFITRHAYVSFDDLGEDEFKLDDLYWDDDYFNMSFEYKLPLDTTVVKAVRFARKLIEIIEDYIEYKARKEVAWYVRSSKSMNERALLRKIDKLFREI